MDKLSEIVKTFERVILILAVLTAGFYAHKYDKQQAIAEQARLVNQGLPPDVLAQYMLQSNKLIKLVRNAQGQTTAVTKYVPEEGGITVVAKNQADLAKKLEALQAELRASKTSTDTAKIEVELNKVANEMNQAPEIKVNDWGFTSRFGYGMAIVPGHSINYNINGGGRLELPISPMFDWKYFYWHRWGAEVQANLMFAGPEFSRHVDDFTPKWMHIINTELAGSVGPGYTGGLAGSVNLRTNW